MFLLCRGIKRKAISSVTVPDNGAHNGVDSTDLFAELSKKYSAMINENRIVYSFGKHERLLAAHLIKFDEILLNFVDDLYPHKVINFFNVTYTYLT